MPVVRSADNHRIGQFLSACEHFAVVPETHFGSHVMLVGQILEAMVQDVGHANHLHGPWVEAGIA